MSGMHIDPAGGRGITEVRKETHSKLGKGRKEHGETLGWKRWRRGKGGKRGSKEGHGTQSAAAADAAIHLTFDGQHRRTSIWCFSGGKERAWGVCGGIGTERIREAQGYDVGFCLRHLIICSSSSRHRLIICSSSSHHFLINFSSL